jgi:hypothetical protein
MIPHLVSERASRLELILTPHRSPDGFNFVRIRRRTAELADIRESELSAWLNTYAAQLQSSAIRA